MTTATTTTGAPPARRALLLAGHPPGRGSGSSARGAVTLAALRGCCAEVDALAFARSGEHRFADPAIVLVDHPGRAGPVDRLRGLLDGGSFYLPDRQAALEARARSLIGSGRLASHYDVVWAHSSLMARVGRRAFGARARVLDIDNIAGVELLRHAEATRAVSPQGLYRRLNGRAVAREERRRARAYDRVVVTSSEERERLGDVGTPVEVVPNTLACDAEPLDPGEAPPALLFVGSLDYEPNLDGLRFLFAEILPRIREAHPEVELTVAGRNPIPEVERSCRDAGARLVANAPSLDPLYRSARAVVAPLRLGGGTRYKLIEAMAYGSAIVATPAATAGLGLTDGHDARIEASPERLAAACAELLADPARARRLGAAARDRWAASFQPAAAQRAIAALVEDLAPMAV